MTTHTVEYIKHCSSSRIADYINLNLITILDTSAEFQVYLLNHSKKKYIDIIWLKSRGLFKETAIEYFCRSPFYDPSANNQSLLGNIFKFIITYVIYLFSEHY